MRHGALGILLSAGIGGAVWLVAGMGPAQAALAAGLLATAIEVAAVTALRPALRPPYEGLLQRWALGLALRMVGVAVVGWAVLGWRERFPVLPTALGFVGVLLPLLGLEMRLVLTRLQTTR